MTVTITSFELLPMQEDEEPGFPSYRIRGTVDGIPFGTDIAVEIDGRDVDFENQTGPAKDWENEVPIFDELCRNEEWLQLHGKQCEAFYG